MRTRQFLFAIAITGLLGAGTPLVGGQPDFAERIASEIEDALAVRPTLVVWLFDRSTGSEALRTTVLAGLPAIYRSRDAEGRRAPPPRPLMSVAVTFGKDVAFPLRDPTESYEEFWKAADRIRDDAEPTSLVAAALGQAADIYLPYRERRPWHLIFVVVTSKAGDDLGQSDDLANRFHQANVPVHVIGATVPFSTRALTDLVGKVPAGTRPKNSDSRQWDRIDMTYPDGGEDSGLTNSGFGPFALSRLSQQTGGEFIGARGMVASDQRTFTPEFVRKFAPDYVSEKKYQELLAANKCRQALVEAAVLPHAGVLFRPQKSFPKRNEAQLNNLLGQAQRASAQVEPQLNRLYEVLAAAESDRERLTGARWQIAYDLAMGRVLAAKARNDGYNAMLALLKQGKPFANAKSTTWVLREAETTAGASALENMARKSRQYLERTIQEHPGTPWAESATRELAAPMGWAWEEQ